MIKIGDIVDNRYRLLETIGSGGMADVFLANDLISNQFVAVKVLKDELSNDKERVDKFIEEIKISSSMRHLNIVQVYNGGLVDGRPFIVMEYFKEQTLSNRLDFLVRFSLSEAINIIIQAIDAVGYTHAHGLIHRDIKPQNIFYLPNGTIKLGDFGIATAQIGGDTSIIGSVDYLAPEVCQGRPFSIRSDIYALGITFYQLLTGRLPFESERIEIVISNQINKKLTKASEIVEGIPRAIDEIIAKATAKNIGDRYSTSEQFKNDLLAYKNGTYKSESFIKKLLKNI